MTGALSQLVAYGAQDVYLTGDPQMSFWKHKFSRYRNFALESIRQTIVGTVQNDGDISFTLSRSGDLVYNIMLPITMKRGPVNLLSKPYYSAEQFIDHVELYIGGQKVFEFGHEWFRMYDELFYTYAQEQAYRNMVDWGNEPQGYLRTFYLPIPVWFNAFAPGSAIPLIALQYHEIQFKIKLGNLNNIPGIDPTFMPQIEAYADYVFLDTQERVWFAQNPHEYIVQQVQFQQFPIKIDEQQRNFRFELNFNHPTKALIWACSPGSYAHGQYTFLRGPVDFQTLGPIDSAVLLLNGQERFTRREGAYFTLANPWATSDGQYSSAGIYSYGFGIHTQKNDPSGTLNFSRIDNAILQVRTKAATIVDVQAPSLVTVPENQTSAGSIILNTCYVWGVNYNVDSIAFKSIMPRTSGPCAWETHLDFQAPAVVYVSC